MPSKHPPIQFRPGKELRDWLEAQRRPGESAGEAARRLLYDQMHAPQASPPSPQG